MKKTIVYIGLLLLMVIGVNAVCDSYGRCTYTACEEAKACIDEYYGQEVSVACDFNHDGKVSLSDYGMYGNNHNNETWCEGFFPPKIVSTITTTVVNGGSGMSNSYLSLLLSGTKDIFDRFNNFVDYLKTLFVTRNEFKDYKYELAEKQCNEDFDSFTEYKELGKCYNKSIEEIYGVGCVKVQSLNEFKGYKTVCP